MPTPYGLVVAALYGSLSDQIHAVCIWGVLQEGCALTSLLVRYTRCMYAYAYLTGRGVCTQTPSPRGDTVAHQPPREACFHGSRGDELHLRAAQRSAAQRSAAQPNSELARYRAARVRKPGAPHHPRTGQPQLQGSQLHGGGLCVCVISLAPPTLKMYTRLARAAVKGSADVPVWSSQGRTA